MTTPTGNPAWLRTSAFDTYGGDLNKQNYQSQGVVNPRTDVGAEGFSRLTADVASIARTVEFCSMLVQCDDATPGPPTVVNCRLMTGVTAVSYVGNAPPTGFPTVARNGNGDVSVTFASSYSDEYGVAGAFIAKDPIANFVGSSGGLATPDRVSSTVIRVRCFSLLAVALVSPKFTLTVGSGT